MKRIALSGIKGFGKYALVDDEDYELVISRKWFFGSNGYVNSGVGRLHRLIMKANSQQLVDHINGNKLDNRRSNLRFCNKSQNGSNSSLSKNNKSGYKGVHFDKSRNKWIVSIKVNYKNNHIGRYNNIKDAALAYNKAAKKYFGEFARLNIIPDNHLKGEHNV